MLKLIWINSNKKSKYFNQFKLLVESGMYIEEPVPPVVDLNDKESINTNYYLSRLKHEYDGIIFILDDKKVFISKDNNHQQLI